MSERGDAPLMAAPGTAPTGGHKAEEARTGRLIRGVPIAVIALSLAISALATISLWNSNLAESRMELERLSLAAAQQTQWQLDRLDHLMQSGAVWLARMEDVENVADLRLYERFQPRLQALEAVESLIISNAEGTLRVITRETVAVPATAFDPRQLFVFYQTHPPADLVIGRAFWMQSGRTWVFPMSHRVLDPTGKLVGAITALVRADVLTERFRSIAPKADLRILLLNAGNELLVGRSNEKNSRAVEPNEVEIADSGFDDDWRGLPVSSHLVHARPLTGLPLRIVAALPRSAYQAQFQGQALLLLGISMAAGIGLTAIASLFGMQVLAVHKKLRSERDFADRMMDSADALVLVLDREGRILRRNAGVAAIDQTRPDGAATTLIDLCSSESAEEAMAALARVWNDGRSGFESGIVHTDAQNAVIKWTLSPLPQALGVPQAIVCFGFDITELRESWRSLARTNAIMEHVLSLANAYYWVGRPTPTLDDIGTEGLIYSDAAAGMYGCAESELHDLTSVIVERFVHPDDRAPYFDGLRNFLQGQDQRYGYAYRLRRPEGGYRHCVGVMEKILDANGQIAEIIGVDQDVSVREQTSALLAESAVKLRRAHRLANLCFMTMDASAPALRLEPAITGFSEEAADILGHSAERLNRDSRSYIDRVIDPADRDRFRAEWTAFMNSDSAGGKFQHRIVHGDGTERHVRVGVEKIPGPGGQILQIIGVIQDITDQRHREFDLLTAKRDAEIANRAKTEFLANMSHELRTPLNAVIGFSQLIRDQNFGPVSDRYVGYANDIYHSGMMLLDLINDILDLSRIETGRHRLNDDVIAVQELIQECVKVLSTPANEKGVRIEIEQSNLRIGLKADARAMKQVVLNILSNAVKFTPSGGSVGVANEIGSNGNLEIRISDTGIGIDPLVIKDLFQPFRQADSQISREYGGTGLGLAISRSLVLLHGGDIRLESHLRQGTTVHVVLPANRVLLAPVIDRKMA